MVNKKIQRMVVGEQKFVKTSLRSHIRFHHDICFHSLEEITCFINNDEYAELTYIYSF